MKKSHEFHEAYRCSRVDLYGVRVFGWLLISLNVGTHNLMGTTEPGEADSTLITFLIAVSMFTYGCERCSREDA